MKGFVAIITLLVVTGMAVAQVPQSVEPHPQKSNSTQSQTSGNTTPPSSGQNAQPATPGAQQPSAPTGKHLPVAKTPEEYKAYQDAEAKPDAPSAEQAADAFAQKFPDSELRGALYQRVMLQYQQANNSEKVVEVGRKTVNAEPDNAIALAIVASVLSVKTHDTDLDRDERLAEAKKDAQKAIELANAGQAVPAGTPPEQAAMYKDTILSTAYSALGSVDFANKNYASAEQNLRKAVEPSHAQPDAINFYELALTLQRENKNQDALDATTKCQDAAKDNPPVANACKNLGDYLQKVVNNPPAK